MLALSWLKILAGPAVRTERRQLKTLSHLSWMHSCRLQEEKPHNEKIEEPKSDTEEIQQKRKYTRRNTE